MQTVTITIIRQSNGMFTVRRDVGTGQGGIAFAKREAVDAYAMRLQEESGGPIMAKITVHDHTKEGKGLTIAKAEQRIQSAQAVFETDSR